MKYADLFNKKGYHYLDKIEEPDINSLRISINRCKVNENSEDLVVDDKIISDVHSIEIDEKLPLIQLNFDSYVSYSVINESFTVLDDYEIFEGNSFRIFKKSRYIDFINIGTIAKDIFYEETYTHYQIACLNHIVDVISFNEPQIIEIYR
ncbi:hypothetical protein [Bacillus sp. EAC]|uniref:hypothetical protein n=1 Tax=Bacillus sp. EAC TaxID=1978338 RepID=UPI000B44B829|nr:hypothetical protein [Bacillus sp. EAC]